MNHVAVPSIYSTPDGPTSTVFQAKLTNDITDTNYTWKERKNVLAGYQYFVGRPRLRIVRSIASPCFGNDHRFPGDNYCFNWNYMYKGIETTQKYPEILNFTGVPMKYRGFKNDYSNIADIGNIPQAGYSYDLPINRTNAINDLKKLQISEKFLSLNTRAIILEFVVVNRDINIVSSAKLTTEFTTSGLIVPSFHIRTVKYSQNEDGADDWILVGAQTVMYLIFIIRIATWIYSLSKLQPLIREISNQIAGYTQQRKDSNERADRMEKQRERKIRLREREKRKRSRIENHTAKRNLKSGSSTQEDKKISTSSPVSPINNDERSRSDSLKRPYSSNDHLKYSTTRSNHAAKKCFGHRVKCPRFHLSRDLRRHHWTQEDIVTPYEQDSESNVNVVCRCRPKSKWFNCIRGCFNCLNRKTCFCSCFCCNANSCEMIRSTAEKLNDDHPEMVPTVSMINIDSFHHGCLLLFPCFRSIQNERRLRHSNTYTDVRDESTRHHGGCCCCCRTIDCSHHVLSRNYGTFFTQSLTFEIGLIIIYSFIAGYHVQELTYFEAGYGKMSDDKLYNPLLQDYIRDNSWRVIWLGLLASVTLVEWLVWLSKLSRTFSVLFMVVEDMFIRLFQFAIFFVIVAAIFGILRYSVFGMEIRTYGLLDYLMSPFKEINGERVVSTDDLSRANGSISSVIDTVFIFIMILLMANLLIAFMADAYGDMQQTGSARYAYNQFEAIKLARFAGHAGLAPLGVVDDNHPQGKIDLSISHTLDDHEKKMRNKSINDNMRKFKTRCCSYAIMRGFQY
jgi:hypothetical protein